MNRFFPLALCLLVCVATVVKAQVGETAKELISLETQFNQALVSGDSRFIDRIYADDIVFTNASGSVTTKSDALASINSGDVKFEAIEMSDVRVQDLGNAVVVTGKLLEKGRYKTEDLSGTYRFTDVWQKRNNQWRVVAGHETLIPAIDSTIPADAVTVLKQLEQDWLDAYREGDAGKMANILADDFIGRWGDGSVTDKPQTIEPVRAGKERHSANQMIECNVRLFGQTAVVSGIQTEQSLLAGRDGSGTYSYTDVFVKRDGRWQVVGSETKRVARRSPSSELNVREHLIGAWRQISDEEMLSDGRTVRLDEIGLLTYDPSGHMSGQAMRLSGTQPQTPGDAIYLNNGYDAYFGTYAIDEARHTVTHHVEGGVARQLVGKDLTRSYRFDGDRLVLTPISPDEHWVVVYEKIPTY